MNKRRMKAGLRKARIQRKYTAQYYIFRLLEKLGLKDIAYALFDDVLKETVYVNGEPVLEARIKRRPLVIIAARKKKTRADEILDPPPVPSSPE